MNSNPDADRKRWTQIEELFDGALDREPGDRDAYLDEACGGDRALRSKVEALISANASGGTRVAQMIRATAGRALAAQASSDRMIGPYRVVDTLGQGGMGAVYLAQRNDREYDQTVAIKLLHRTLLSPELLQRFRSERQILANLNHPNVAHLLDGGRTDDGVPYLVMEYVEGEPIDVYCDGNDLTVRQRIELFLQVCQAVELAHQNLIVHRDLKPGNILVTGEGVPKLLDFGIAKILSPDTVSGATDLTRHGDRLLTPDQASPEQVLGRPVTTASDIYSLGVLLYELLCGRRPFRLNGLSPGDMERLICETEPERPSASIDSTPTVEGTRIAVDPTAVAIARGVTPEKLRRQLRGDLDKIVLYAMRKEPERRYRSVGLFAEDLRRYLHGLPVTAQNDTFSYRTGKFVRRNRLGVGLGTTLVVFLAGFAVITSMQARRIAQERDLASHSMSFLVDMITATDPEENLGREVTAREIFDRGAARVDVQLQDQPELRMVLQQTIGRVYHSLGRYDQAVASLESSIAVREQELGADDAGLVPSLNLLGAVHRDRGAWDDAERLHRRALGIARTHHGGVHEHVAVSQSRLAETLEEMDALDEAESLYRASLAVYSELGEEFARDEADVHSGLGLLLRRRGDFDDAGEELRTALDLHRRLLGPRHPKVAHALENLAINLQARGELGAAGPLYRESLDILTEVYDADHPKISLASANMGRYLYARERYADAERLFRSVLANETRRRGEQHQWTTFAAVELARTLRAQGKLAEAESLYIDAVRVYETTLGERHTLLAEALRNLGDLRREQGRAVEGRGPLERALAMSAQLHGDGHWHIAACQSDLAAVYLELGQRARARSLLETAVTGLASSLGEGHRLSRLAAERRERAIAAGT